MVKILVDVNIPRLNALSKERVEGDIPFALVQARQGLPIGTFIEKAIKMFDVPSIVCGNGN